MTFNELCVAVHVHSSWSYDGNWSLEDVADGFRRMGFDAVLMAEHDRTFSAERWREYVDACSAASSETLLLIPGIEYSDPGDVVHVPVWGAAEFLGRDRQTVDLLAEANSLNAVSVLAHPLRREAWRHFDDAWLDLLSGVEVVNSRHGDLRSHDDAASFTTATSTLLPFFSLDFHRGRDLKNLGMRARIGGERSAEAVLDAVRAGRLLPDADRSNRVLGPKVARARRIIKRLK
jgi:hypothetical protein